MRLPGREAVWRWGPVVGLMAVIFFVSSLSDLPATPGGLSDVGAHALAYCALGVAMSRALRDSGTGALTPRTALAAVALTVAYGLTDEFHQRFVPGRFAEWRDLTADTVGAVLGVGLVWAWSIVFSARTSRSRSDS